MRGTIMSGTRPDDLRPGTELFVNGNRENSNNYLYDGIDNNTRLTLVTVMRPNVEAIKEFKVQTNLYSADQGRNPGGQINVVTKSGGNAIHGAVYEFLRNARFDANNFFANRAGQEKPPFEQNQFGGAIGGPIVRNKTFFFADYDGFRQELGRVFVNTVPTAKMRQGDFSEVGTIYDPLTTVAVPGGGVTRQPFPGNVIPQNRWDPVTAKLMNAYPMPTTSALANNLVTTPSRTQNWNQFDVRVDHTQSERNNFLGRYSWSKTSTINPYTFAPVQLPGVVESRRPRQRGHLRGSFRSARRARRVRLGACVLVASASGFARRLQPLQSRVHAGRRRLRRPTRRTARRAQRQPAAWAGWHPDLQPGELYGHRSQPLAADFPAREDVSSRDQPDVCRRQAHDQDRASTCGAGTWASFKPTAATAASTSRRTSPTTR